MHNPFNDIQSKWEISNMIHRPKRAGHLENYWHIRIR
jgi:hypothetical protein